VLSNPVKKKKKRKKKKMPTVWAILLAVRTCGLFLLWIHLTTASRQGDRAAFLWARLDLSVSQQSTCKMVLIVLFYSAILYLSGLCRPQAIQRKTGFLSVCTQCLAQQLRLDSSLMTDGW